MSCHNTVVCRLNGKSTQSIYPEDTTRLYPPQVQLRTHHLPLSMWNHKRYKHPSLCPLVTGQCKTARHHSLTTTTMIIFLVYLFCHVKSFRHSISQNSARKDPVASNPKPRTKLRTAMPSDYPQREELPFTIGWRAFCSSTT